MKKDEKLLLWTERLQAFPGQWTDLQGRVPGTSDSCFYLGILEPQITCTRKRITAGTGFCKDADGTGTFHKRVLNGKYTSAYFYHRQYPD